MLDMNQCIKGYSKQNMDFAVKPSKFLGEDITTVLPLSEKDRNAIILGFCRATEKEETVKVPYAFDKMEFLATITPLKKEQPEKYNYFVKVTPTVVERAY